MATTYNKTNYTKNSPYFNTPKFGMFLDVANYRPISKKSTDKLYTINATYNLRPDLLASDLYDSHLLWWIFAMRNPDKLKDPFFGFTTGTQIYLPTKSTVVSYLGI